MQRKVEYVRNNLYALLMNELMLVEILTAMFNSVNHLTAYTLIQVKITIIKHNKGTMRYNHLISE